MTQNENSDAQGLGLLKFDPIVLVWDVAKQWLLILMVVLIVGMSAYSYATVSYQPQYSTAITYVTYTRSSTATVYSNLSSATAVASVFEELLNSSLLQGVVLRESGLERFDGNITAQVVPETNLLNVTVTGKDPRSVFLMAKAIVEHHEDVTYQVVDNVSLEVLKGAEVAAAPMNRADAMNAMKKMGFLAGLAACALFAALSFTRAMVRSSRLKMTGLTGLSGRLATN
jgi:capsular polysaccharide biosynthesis protein